MIQVLLADHQQGMFTELSVLYAKYRPEKRKSALYVSWSQADRAVMEHLKLFWQRCNLVSQLLSCLKV